MFFFRLHVQNAPPHRSLNNITAPIRCGPFETKQPEPPKSTNRSGRGHVYFFTLTSEIMSSKQKPHTRCTLQTKDGEKEEEWGQRSRKKVKRAENIQQKTHHRKTCWPKCVRNSSPLKWEQVQTCSSTTGCIQEQDAWKDMREKSHT